MFNLKQDVLKSYLGKSIKQICPNEYTNDNDNHCAHFVSHVMGYKFGVTCRTMGKSKGSAANLRVQEIFPKCPTVGTWDSRPAALVNCLVFISNASHVDVTHKVFANVPRKHIGIYFGGFVWHYSNRQHKVVNQNPAEFSHHYPAPDNAMFYGALPVE